MIAALIAFCLIVAVVCWFSFWFMVANQSDSSFVFAACFTCSFGIPFAAAIGFASDHRPQSTSVYVENGLCYRQEMIGKLIRNIEVVCPTDKAQ